MSHGLPEHIVQRFEGRAILLADIGISDVAWRREDALALVDEALQGSEVAVLGGDVLSRESRTTFAHDYSNWFSEITDGEDWSDYASRSRTEAARFIRSFRETEGKEYAYVLVFSPSLPRRAV